MSVFSDTLKNQSGSGIYGQRGAQDDPDIMGMDAELRRRKLNDTARMMDLQRTNELTQRQDPLKNIFNPEGSNPSGAPIGTDGKPMGVVFKDTHPDLTAGQKGELDIKSAKADADIQAKTDANALGASKLDLEGKKLDLGRQHLELDQKKNQQIFDTKHADMQRKVDDAERTAQFNREKFNQDTTNKESLLAAHKAEKEAAQARFELENARKDSQFEELKRKHDSEIAAMKERLRQSRSSKVTTKLDPGGNERDVNTTKGGDENDPLGLLIP